MADRYPLPKELPANLSPNSETRSWEQKPHGGVSFMPPKGIKTRLASSAPEGSFTSWKAGLPLEDHF